MLATKERSYYRSVQSARPAYVPCSQTMKSSNHHLPFLLCHQGVSQSPSILLTWHSRYSTHLHEEKEMMKTRGCACIPNTQVHYPSNPQQPSPVYFLTPKKCAIFGVCCEGIPRQIQVYAFYNAHMYIPSIKNIHKIYLLIQGILPD